MKKYIVLFMLTLISAVAFAQDAAGGMAVDLRSSGKIYVVVAVIAVVFLGIAFYLFSIDKRLKKIERDK